MFGLVAIAIEMDMIFVLDVPDCMTSSISLLLDSIIIYIMIIMFHLPLFFVKLNEKLLKYSTYTSSYYIVWLLFCIYN